ncbi:T9SS type A sorting domain-containing protein [Hymenobacter actinosclerus]|nr:T9SS type A sorting domain-containing protein [Hymenobacter actinosclerus]
MKLPLFSLVGKAPNPVWQRLLPLLALFVTLGTSFQARAQDNSSITGSSIIIDRGAGNETFGGQNGVPAPAFNNYNLGTFDISNFNTKVLLNGGTVNTQENAPDVISAGRLAYRIRANGSTTNLVTGVIELVQGTPTNNNRTFSLNSANVNILAGLAAGTYGISVQYTVDGVNADSGEDFTKTDPPGAFYRATFTVIGIRPTEPPTSTTWTGGKNDNWFDPANWTQGVPNRNKDANIPDFGAGSTVQYPNIYSNAVKPDSETKNTVTNPDGTTSEVITFVPGYDNTATGPRGASGPAETRTFTMRGTSQAQRSISRLQVGRLNVYGDFNNSQDSFIQRDGTTISFAGTTQSISGSTSGFVNIEIDGGGVKTLVNNFKVQAGGVLRFINGVLKTDSSRIDTNFIELLPAVNSNGSSGRIEGESENSYLRGYVTTSQFALVGVPQDFGNIGATLTFNGNSPGSVTVTRNSAQNYATISNGSNSRPSIRRIFGVRPSPPSTNIGGLSATFVFKYLDSETRNLTSVTSPNSLDESKFALFVSGTGGDVFGQLGRDALDTSTNTLIKNNVTSFATFTLSEFTAPLPVTLVSFIAKRVGNNAEISWETVAELNNRGYEVQVSNDGRNYRALTFVPSTNPNSNQLLRYRYTDTEAAKTGVRYYRLRQIDLDGTDHYYAPKVVTFDGGVAVGKAEVIAFPNPFGQVLSLTANSAAAGPAKLSVTDMTGRVVAQQTVQLNAGTNDVSVPNVANLQSGVYLVRLVLPSGEAKVIRVNKE